MDVVDLVKLANALGPLVASLGPHGMYIVVILVLWKRLQTQQDQQVQQYQELLAKVVATLEEFKD